MGQVLPGLPTADTNATNGKCWGEVISFPDPLQRGYKWPFLFGGESGFETRGEEAWVLLLVYLYIQPNLVRTLLHSAVTDNSAPYTVTPHLLLCAERELLTDRARRFVFEVRILSCALALHFQWLLSWLRHRKVICHQLEVICYQPSPWIRLDHSVKMSASYFLSSSW